MSNSRKDVDFVVHQAASGSVPRSIEDLATSNEVNVSEFLNMLEAERNQKIRLCIYGASSSTMAIKKIFQRWKRS